MACVNGFRACGKLRGKLAELSLFPTQARANSGIPCFPQMEERLKSFIPIGESRFLNIFTHSTTTMFLNKSVFLYLGIVHNQACTYAVEAR